VLQHIDLDLQLIQVCRNAMLLIERT